MPDVSVARSRKIRYSPRGPDDLGTLPSYLSQILQKNFCAMLGRGTRRSEDTSSDIASFSRQ